MGIAMQWLTVVSALVFTTWALYISLVEHPARLRIDPASALGSARAIIWQRCLRRRLSPSA